MFLHREHARAMHAPEFVITTQLLHYNALHIQSSVQYCTELKRKGKHIHILAVDVNLGILSVFDD